MIIKATTVFFENGNNFILSTTNRSFGKLYNPIAINVANAAPFIPYFGIKIKFNPTTTKTNKTPKSKTIL